MKISLLHPSRGRPQKAVEAIEYWMARTGHKDFDIEYILSIDSSDITKDEYYEAYAVGTGGCVIFNDNSSVVEATNRAAERSTGDILIYFSDDFRCPQDWNELVLKEFENENRPLLLKVDDCLQHFATRIVTIPIMNRLLYNKLGYFWHPAYKSMFCDEHLFWVAHRIGALKNCPHLKFPHHHYSNPDDKIRSDRDETYKRSEANWDQGKAMFQLHKSQGFPI